MHSHGRKIHNRISPCIHPPPLSINRQWIINVFRLLSTPNIWSSKRLFCSAKRVLLISILENKQDVQILSRLIAYFLHRSFVSLSISRCCTLFVMPFTMPGSSSGCKKYTFWGRESSCNSENWIFILCAWERSGRQGRCLSPPYHISMLQMSLDFLLFVNIYTTRRQKENIFWRERMTCRRSHPNVSSYNSLKVCNINICLNMMSSYMKPSYNTLI